MTGQHRLAAWRGRRKKRTVASLALIALGAVVVSALPSVAAPGDETLTLTLAQETGTGPFDTDDTPGNDSGAANDVVRTNDTIAYTVGVRYEGGDATAPTIAFTLPQGQELRGLPPFCLAGSSVTPTSLGAPVLPVTTTSYQSLPVQMVTCVVANQSEGTALDYRFVAKVRGEVPQGTTMGPFSASATSAQVVTPSTSPAVSQTVSAAANFDVSKRADASTSTSGPLWMKNSGACSFDTTRQCQQVQYPLTISAPDSAKGSTPLASPITMTDDISPQTYFGATAWANAIALAGSEAAAIAKYAPRLQSCSDVQNLQPHLPGSAGAFADLNSVSNSGSISCAQPGGVGNPVNIAITGADTTAVKLPTTTGTGNALPATNGFVVALQVNLEIPLDAIREIGDAGSEGSSWSLQTRNSYSDIVMTDINGSPNNGEITANNTRDALLPLGAGSGNVNKFFSGIYGAPGNTPIQTFWPGYGAWEGPPGSRYIREGNIVVVPGQVVQSNLYMSHTGSVPNSGDQFSKSFMGCDVWDDSKLGLTPGNYVGGPTGRIRPSGGAAAWVQTYNPNDNVVAPISELRNLKIQYSSGPAGSGASSDCTTGTWYDSPEDVPGAVLDAQGVFSGVNRVRASFTSEFESAADYVYVAVAIAQTVRPSLVAGEVIPNWATFKTVNGVKDMDGILSDPTPYSLANYNPSNHTGVFGDRLLVGEVVARVKKYVRNGGSGDFTDTAVPQYTAGATVDYRLNPTLTSGVSTSLTAPVTVEDCLPRYQQLLSSKREGSGEPFEPTVVSSTTPTGAGLTCDPGQTYVRWDLGQIEINQPIDPIIYTVEILGTVRNGTYTNTTLVSSPGDLSNADLRTDTAQVQIVVPTGIKIAKSTPQTVVEVNPDGVAAPRQLRWSVDFANVDAPQNVSNVDVIDVLPTDGLNGSDFTGSLRFDSAAVTAGTGIALRYTKTPSPAIAIDPAHSSNAAAGATVWCDAPAGGAVVSGSGTAADCPASPAQVTGLRFVRPGDFEPGDELTVGITMTPSGNRGGDVYVNRTSGRADGVSQSVGPASRAIEIISSSIGDRVWIDQDRDGVQDAGEPGLSGFTVRLSGTDLDGNTVTASTTTGADGSYLFDGLASGTYAVTFDPASLKAWQTFTQQGVGGDRAEDSDGEVTTGVTAPIVLAPDSANLDIDQGVVLEPSQPGYVTTISDQATEVGDRVTDQVVVSGLVPGAPVQMKWELYGPYPTKAAITCAPGSVFAEGTMTVAGNGTVTTPPVTLTKAGWYTYVQSNEASAAYDAQRTACAIPAETTHTTVKQAPPGKSEVKVSTVSSRQALVLPSRGGVKVTDKVIVRGLPKGVKARVTGALYGPFETEKAIRCTKAHVVKKVAFTATGRARTMTNYRSKAVRVTEPGWYSWSMTVAGTTFTKGATEGCGVARETLIATRAAPPVPSVPTGFTGEARESALSAVESDVAGVFADGDLDFLEQIAQVLDVADGVEDGNIPAGDAGDLPVVSVKEAQELAERQASGIDVPQVALAPRHTRRLYSPPNGRGVVRRAGTSLSIPSLGIKTSVDDSRVTGGVLAVPKDVRRVGWYSRTAHVDDVIGSTVIAGHVSDDRDNPGALYRLRSLKKGAVVTVTENGRTRRFRVTRMRTYQRTGQLPADAFATTGAHRLTLITCTGKVTYPNGKFHYTKNLVVTADEI